MQHGFVARPSNILVYDPAREVWLSQAYILYKVTISGVSHELDSKGPSSATLCNQCMCFHETFPSKSHLRPDTPLA